MPAAVVLRCAHPPLGAPGVAFPGRALGALTAVTDAVGTITRMSNQLLVTVPGWVGPSEAARILSELLGGRDFYGEGNSGSEAVTWVSEATDTAHLGCFIRLVMTNSEGIRRGRGFFMTSAGDVHGRRRLVVRDGPFWREVMGRLLATVGGSMRNEYHPGPELAVRPVRVRVDLDDEVTLAWLARRLARRRFDDPERLYALASVEL
jgi:hypothetical protein